jgi:hypothetical protein
MMSFSLNTLPNQAYWANASTFLDERQTDWLRVYTALAPPAFGTLPREASRA